MGLWVSISFVDACHGSYPPGNSLHSLRSARFVEWITGAVPCCCSPPSALGAVPPLDIAFVGLIVHSYLHWATGSLQACFVLFSTGWVLLCCLISPTKFCYPHSILTSVMQFFVHFLLLVMPTTICWVFSSTFCYDRCHCSFVGVLWEPGCLLPWVLLFTVSYYFHLGLLVHFVLFILFYSTLFYIAVSPFVAVRFRCLPSLPYVVWILIFLLIRFLSVCNYHYFTLFTYGLHWYCCWFVAVRRLVEVQVPVSFVTFEFVIPFITWPDLVIICCSFVGYTQVFCSLLFISILHGGTGVSVLRCVTSFPIYLWPADVDLPDTCCSITVHFIDLLFQLLSLEPGTNIACPWLNIWEHLWFPTGVHLLRTLLRANVILTGCGVLFDAGMLCITAFRTFVCSITFWWNCSLGERVLGGHELEQQRFPFAGGCCCSHFIACDTVFIYSRNGRFGTNGGWDSCYLEDCPTI